MAVLKTGMGLFFSLLDQFGISSFSNTFRAEAFNPNQHLLSQFIEKENAYNVYQFWWPEMVLLSNHQKLKIIVTFRDISPEDMLV